VKESISATADLFEVFDEVTKPDWSSSLVQQGVALLISMLRMCWLRVTQDQNIAENKQTPPFCLEIYL